MNSSYGNGAHDFCADIVKSTLSISDHVNLLRERLLAGGNENEDLQKQRAALALHCASSLVGFLPGLIEINDFLQNCSEASNDGGPSNDPPGSGARRSLNGYPQRLPASNYNPLCTSQIAKPQIVTGGRTERNEDGRPRGSQPNSSESRILEKFQQVEICRTKLTSGQTLSAVISWIESPSLFWIQSKCSPSVKSLWSLREIIDLGLQSLNRSAIVAGSYVLAPYGEKHEYFRARVIDTAPRVAVLDGSVRVLYIDYGNTDYISPEMFYELPNCYRDNAWCAYPCCLIGVRPHADKWSRVESELFFAAVQKHGETVEVFVNKAGDLNDQFVSKVRVRLIDGSVNKEEIDTSFGVVSPECCEAFDIERAPVKLEDWHKPEYHDAEVRRILSGQ